DVQGSGVVQDGVMAIFGQALGGGVEEQLHGAIAEGPADVDKASHYLGSAATTFAVVQQDTPGIKQLFIELASVMSGVGHPDEAGSDSHSWVHMWRVFCANQCFTGG